MWTRKKNETMVLGSSRFENAPSIYFERSAHMLRNPKALIGQLATSYVWLSFHPVAAAEIYHSGAWNWILSLLINSGVLIENTQLCNSSGSLSWLRLSRLFSSMDASIGIPKNIAKMWGFTTIMLLVPLFKLLLIALVHWWAFFGVIGTGPESL